MTTSKGLRRKGSFIAKDSQGHSRRLYVWAHIIDVGLDPDEVIEGMIGIKTERGQSVNVIRVVLKDLIVEGYSLSPLVLGHEGVEGR